MRNTIRQFVEIISSTLPIQGTIYEFGAFQVPGQEGFANLRSYFPGQEYIGTDVQPGPGVDRILDLHEIDLPDESAGTALCMETLEHVEYPRQAVNEIFRVLKEGGLAVFSSHMNFPIHRHPFDYWRFTPDGFRSLLKPFPVQFVGWAGQDDNPHTIVGLGFKGRDLDLSGFLGRFSGWKVAAHDLMYG